MYALKHKATGNLLSVEAVSETNSDWGFDGEDERMVDYTTIYLRVFLSDMPQHYPVYVTASKADAFNLKKHRETSNIRLLETSDSVVVVEVKEKKKTRRKNEKPQ
jgi:hypothetical protein